MELLRGWLRLGILIITVVEIIALVYVVIAAIYVETILISILSSIVVGSIHIMRLANVTSCSCCCGVTARFIQEGIIYAIIAVVIYLSWSIFKLSTIFINCVLLMLLRLLNLRWWNMLLLLLLLRVVEILIVVIPTRNILIGKVILWIVHILILLLSIIMLPRYKYFYPFSSSSKLLLNLFPFFNFISDFTFHSLNI